MIGAAAPQLDIRQALHSAIRLHGQGRLDEAERLYLSVLDVRPGQFDALHLLGVIHHQRGRHDQAVALIERALSNGQGTAEAHLNLGAALRDGLDGR